MTLQQPVITINAMDLRKEAGRFLDLVDLRKESFIVKLAGKPKAALVPLTDLQELVRMKDEARNEFFAMTDEIRNRATQSGLSDKELEAEIDEAMAKARKEISTSKRE